MNGGGNLGDRGEHARVGAQLLLFFEHRGLKPYRCFASGCCKRDAGFGLGCGKRFLYNRGQDLHDRGGLAGTRATRDHAQVSARGERCGCALQVRWLSVLEVN
jgi:hypothetical protein